MATDTTDQPLPAPAEVPEPDLEDDFFAERIAAEAEQILGGEVPGEEAAVAPSALARLFGGDPQTATRRANRLIALYGHLEDELADAEATAAQAIADWEAYRERQREQIERRKRSVEMALTIYATDWHHPSKRTIGLPTGDLKRRVVPPTIKLAEDDRLLDFTRQQPFELYDALVKQIEKLDRRAFRQHLQADENGRVLFDGEVLEIMDHTGDGGEVAVPLAWLEYRQESFTVKPKRHGRPPAGGEVILSAHARERFAERGGDLYGGGDPDERLAELAEDARGFARRAGQTEVIYSGLVWCFAVERACWTLVTVKPGPGADRMEGGE